MVMSVKRKAPSGKTPAEPMRKCRTRRCQPQVCDQVESSQIIPRLWVCSAAKCGWNQSAAKAFGNTRSNVIAVVKPAGKKPRQRTMQQLFLSYGAHSLPDRVREHKEKLLPNTNIIALMNKYSKSLARHELQQFEDDYKHFLDEFNEQLADGKIDMKVLAKRLTAYDHEQGIEMHPAFNGFMVNICYTLLICACVNQMQVGCMLPAPPAPA